MTLEEIEKAIAEHEATMESSRLALAALTEQLDKMSKHPKRRTMRQERWVNCCENGWWLSFLTRGDADADATRYQGRLGPAERIVREFDLVDGKCVEHRCGLTGRVIWREGGVERVEKPEPLSDVNGTSLAYCFDGACGRMISVGSLVMLDASKSTAWLRRAVAWVNDGEVAR